MSKLGLFQLFTKFQAGDYESELLNKSSSNETTSPKPGKKLNNRDIRQQKQAEFFEAKAESARLRRETDVQLPRHEKTLTLDDLQGKIYIQMPPRNILFQLGNAILLSRR